MLRLAATQMPMRWARVLICAAVISCEAIAYHLERNPAVSYLSHLGGALTGLCVSLVFSTNVRLRRRDTVLMWFGLSGYMALDGFAFAHGQVAAAALAAVLIPFLAARAGMSCLLYTSPSPRDS